MDLGLSAQRLIDATRKTRGATYATLGAAVEQLRRDQRQSGVEPGEIELRRCMERIKQAGVNIPKLEAELAALDSLSALAETRFALLSARGSVVGAETAIRFLDGELAKQANPDRSSLACEVVTCQTRLNEARARLTKAEDDGQAASEAYRQQLDAATKAGAFGHDLPVVKTAKELDAAINADITIAAKAA